MKKKLFSLALAAVMLLGTAGCSLKTPASVGTIGGVDIPAGVYLLAQYNAYNTASGYVELATGETANNVKAVLKASGTGNVGDTETTETGSEFVSALTQRSLEYFAATESKFNELGGTLDDAATSESANTVDSLWTQSGDLYTANGISKASLTTYMLNSKKANAIEELLYGENGITPVTEAEYSDYINNDCYYVQMVILPLYDSASYVFASEDQQAQIEALAGQCQAELADYATPETAIEDGYTYLYAAATTYLPQVYNVLGATFDSNQLSSYIASELLPPSTLESLSSGDTNAFTDTLDATPDGEWAVVNIGTSIAVARRCDPLTLYSVDELVSGYNLLDEMKSDEVQAMLYEEGAAMEHDLSQSAMNTYSASKIKKSV